jgi:AraC-like DNA-binding protein
MDHNHRTDAALEELDNSEAPNIAEVARKYNLNKSTLSRRFRGVTVSRQEATFIHKILLSDSQEDILIQYINHQASRGLYLTP